MTCPHTDVILNRTFSFRNTPFHSCTEHAPFEPEFAHIKKLSEKFLCYFILLRKHKPFRFECLPLLNIVANDAANEGFSATINTDFIFDYDFYRIHTDLDILFYLPIFINPVKIEILLGLLNMGCMRCE